MVDYTKYPEGFKALAKELNIPFEDEAQRENFLRVVMKQMLIN